MQHCLINLNLRDEPAITGTDVTVACILEELALGDSIEQICDKHRISKEHVHAALSYAEMNLPQHKLDRFLYSISSDHTAPDDDDDDMDYSLLAENAGYFGRDTCSLHILYKYRKQASRNAARTEIKTR
jgi:hypothetical protein